MISCSLSRNRLKAVSLVLMLVILFALVGIICSRGHAQSSACPPGAAPSADPSHPYFRPGETVYVILDGNFTPSQEDQIKRGLDSWSTANAQNGSGVHFQYDQGPPSEVADPTIITFTQGSCASSYNGPNGPDAS
jgi:hypothetical protein